MQGGEREPSASLPMPLLIHWCLAPVLSIPHLLQVGGIPLERTGRCVSAGVGVNVPVEGLGHFGAR